MDFPAHNFAAVDVFSQAQAQKQAPYTIQHPTDVQLHTWFGLLATYVVGALPLKAPGCDLDGVIDPPHLIQDRSLTARPGILLVPTASALSGLAAVWHVTNR